MGFNFQSYLAMCGRAINPVRWKATWQNLEGKTGSEVFNSSANFVNRQFAQIAKVHWWWASPLGMGLVTYGSYKAWHMMYMVRKQKKTAQLVAAAYGQGGQWLNPVPK